MATARALRIWPASRKVSCRPALGVNPWSSLLAIHVGAGGGLKVAGIARQLDQPLGHGR